ncbi:MAG TPA: helix-turn-helix domain-containing protein [Terriglobales bacterium]|jgi:DNA-binding MarR family transcriptional regulator|nr:helix-turn-helix domain-containing protein [Terriglobales bacterium]
MHKRSQIPRKVKSQGLTRSEYKALAEFRYQVRRYLRYMEEKARARGYNPQQYQLLLAIEGLPEGQMPTIKTIAERMQLNHNSAVELVDRCEKGGLLDRARTGRDRRVVTLLPTLKGKRMMEEQASASRAELQEIGPILLSSLQRLTSQRK